ncbi:MAG: histidine phosphatase family protein, partial [Planctomycetota bacterium]
MTKRSAKESGQAFTGSFDEATKVILPDAWVTHLHLLRHGEVERHTSRVVRGQLDVGLSADGLEQTRRAVEWFQSCEGTPDKIVSSDLARCRVMAVQLAEATSAELEITEELREQNLGAWQGRTWPEVTAEDGAAVTAYWDDYLNARPTGGESYGDLHARVGAFWDERVAELRDRRVVFVTHIGVIRSLLCRQLGVSPSEALRFAPAVGSHTGLSLSEAGAVLNALGERPWLDRAWPQRSRGRRENSRPLRLAMSGSAGTGKTTLALRLAKDLGLAYIEEGMRRRLEAGFDLHALDQKGHRALIREMWNEQRAQERDASNGSIADRSPLDFAAFWLHY